MADQSTKTAITVAVIGAIATLAAAFITANRGKADPQVSPTPANSAEESLRQATFGTWFTKFSVHPDAARPALTISVSAREDFLRDGSYNSDSVFRGSHPAPDQWECTCAVVATGEWRIIGQALNSRIKEARVRLVSAGRQGVQLDPQAASAAGFNCDSLSGSLLPGTSSEEKVLEVDATTMRSRGAGAGGQEVITTRTRQPQ